MLMSTSRLEMSLDCFDPKRERETPTDIKIILKYRYIEKPAPRFRQHLTQSTESPLGHPEVSSQCLLPALLPLITLIPRRSELPPTEITSASQPIVF